jgi:hypothetical protein
MSLDICIKARWVFSTVAGLHHYTTYTTSFRELEKLSSATETVGFTFIPFNSTPLVTRARYTKLEVFVRVSPSGGVGGVVVLSSLGCRRANGCGKTTVFPCLHEKARWGGGDA